MTRNQTISMPVKHDWQE